MGWIKWTAAVIAVLTLVVLALDALGQMRWRGRTEALNRRLDAGRLAPTPARYDRRELADLPPPVQRYFRAVLKEGAPLVAAVEVEHLGSFNMSETAEQWKPFTSSQRVVTRRPGFVWDASVAMLPGLPVRVHDAYIGGEGILHPAIFGLFSLMDLRGGGEVARGELMRFFAEAAWYPTALLPSQGVQWQAVDDHSAVATLVDGPVRLSLAFLFGDDDLILSARAEARGRSVGGQVIATPWEGRWSNYQWRNGMRVPMSGEVAWLLPEANKPYWRGTISALRYEFAQGPN